MPFRPIGSSGYKQKLLGKEGRSMGYLDKRLGVFVFGISGCFSMALQAQTVPNQGAVVVPGQGAAKTTVGGQPGVTGNAQVKADPVLDQYLLRWEQEMTKVQTLVAKLQLIEVDKTFGARKTSLGMAKYMKAGSQIAPVSLALLELRKENKPEIDKKYLCTANYLYEIQFELKEIKSYELPKPKPGQVGNDNFLLFLFGMKSDEVKRRYDIRLAKEDQHYGYFEIKPRFAADKADFQRAQLVLNRATALPRRVWFEQPNGSETTWDLADLQTQIPLNRAEFDPPVRPAGWREVQQPAMASGASRMPRTNP